MILAALVVSACAADDTPDELPFRDDTPVSDESPDVIDVEPAVTTTTPVVDAAEVVDDAVIPDEPIEFADEGIDPITEACYAEVFADVTDTVDPYELAEQVSDLDYEQQAVLASCLGAGGE